MTEKKTFKNPTQLTVYADHSVYVRTTDDQWSLTMDEWDMEVTFTKKVKPFEVGDRVNLTTSSDDPGRIVYLHQGYAYIVWDSDPVYVDAYSLSELKHVS